MRALWRSQAGTSSCWPGVIYENKVVDGGRGLWIHRVDRTVVWSHHSWGRLRRYRLDGGRSPRVIGRAEQNIMDGSPDFLGASRSARNLDELRKDTVRAAGNSPPSAPAHHG